MSKIKELIIKSGLNKSILVGLILVNGVALLDMIAIILHQGVFSFQFISMLGLISIIMCISVFVFMRLSAVIILIGLISGMLITMLFCNYAEYLKYPSNKEIFTAIIWLYLFVVVLLDRKKFNRTLRDILTHD